MNAGDYLRDRHGQLLLHLTGMMVLSAFLLLTGSGKGVVTLILIVWTFGLAFTLTISFLRQKKQLEELWTILDALPQKYLFMTCIPKPSTAYERQWQELMGVAGKAMIEEVSAVSHQQRDYREYIENWVHEIKVPITALSLICENNRGEVARKIKPQLAQIEEQVERSLFYARSTEMEKDFIVRKTKLSEIVDAALAKYSTLLIQSNVRVETEGLETALYTDAKWLAFIIGQILSNAVKYKADQPVITIAATEENSKLNLSISDNGIGISKAELPRIFDKGFTGSNGRTRGGATGMGLYLCKKLALRLNATLTADSAENEFTTLTLSFPMEQTDF